MDEETDRIWNFTLHYRRTPQNDRHIRTGYERDLMGAVGDGTFQRMTIQFFGPEHAVLPRSAIISIETRPGPPSEGELTQSQGIRALLYGFFRQTNRIYSTTPRNGNGGAPVGDVMNHAHMYLLVQSILSDRHGTIGANTAAAASDDHDDD